MPIKAENRALYPGGSPTSPAWRAIRERILARAGHACEFCGAPDRTWIGRPHGNKRWERATFGEGVLIVLTVAHLDHDPTNSADANLAALCQRCHNRYDAAHRRRNATTTRRRRKAAGDLFLSEKT